MAQHSRAYLRHQDTRAKARTRHVLANVWQWEPRWITPARIGREASTHCASCSCYICSGHDRPSAKDQRDAARHEVGVEEGTP